MHTFFINTSERVNVSRHELLFDNLVSSNRIRSFNYKLDDLNACAEKISETITRDDSITEVYNIIVYVEISKRNEDALAAETVASLQIEETLFSRLYDLGRKPNQALILFGENFTRDAEYGRGNEYRKNVRSAIWSKFPLPELDETRKLLKKVRESFSEITEDNINEYKIAVRTVLTENYSGDSSLKSESDFVISTLYQVAESVRNDDLDKVDLLDELFIALTNQKENVQLPVTVEKVKYAHVRLEDSDFNVQNRTEYRILLYAFYCAISESIILCEALPDVGEDVESGVTLGVDTIPEINWKVLSRELKDKKVILEKELEQIELSDDKFPMFNSALLSEENIISLSFDTPKLITDVKAHRGLTVAQLQSAVNSTLDEIEEKNRDNEKKVTNFITKVTDSFSSAKDTKMKNVRYKNEEEFIENDQLTEAFITKEIDKADSRIAAHKRLSMAATHIDEILEETRIRTDYYFECLKKGLLVYIIGVLFTLCFAIPYAIIQQSLFNEIHGWVFFVVSLAIVIVAYSIGYIAFRRIYKSRIIKELGILCDKFAATQVEKQKCLEEYARLIRSDIPLSFCLTLYQNEFKAFIKNKGKIPEYITYHTKLLDKYLRYIGNLLNELDIANLAKESEPIGEYSSKIAIDRDKYQNNTVYSLFDESVVDSLFIKSDEGGNQ